MRYKPTKVDCTIIRSCAMRSAGTGRVKIEPGERFNLDRGSRAGSNMNLCLVSDQPDHGDTDLGETVEWSDFTKGVELTKDGKGCFDFYVYSLGEYGQLETNVTAYYEDGKLTKIVGTGNGIMWEGGE